MSYWPPWAFRVRRILHPGQGSSHWTFRTSQTTWRPRIIYKTVFNPQWKRSGRAAYPIFAGDHGRQWHGYSMRGLLFAVCALGWIFFSPNDSSFLWLGVTFLRRFLEGPDLSSTACRLIPASFPDQDASVILLETPTALLRSFSLASHIGPVVLEKNLPCFNLVTSSHS